MAHINVATRVLPREGSLEHEMSRTKIFVKRNIYIYIQTYYEDDAAFGHIRPGLKQPDCLKSFS